jgi:hypothetical protein
MIWTIITRKWKRDALQKDLIVLNKSEKENNEENFNLVIFLKYLLLKED